MRAKEQVLRGENKKAARLWTVAALFVVPGAGIEPARLSAGDFESRADFNVYAVSMWFFSAKKQ